MNYLISDESEDWLGLVPHLEPGAHVAVHSLRADETGIAGRLAGLQLRDTLAVLWPGMTSHVLLFRMPLQEPTVAQQVLSTGTGGLNIDATRVGNNGGTMRSEQVPYPKNPDGSENRSQWARTGHRTVQRSAGPLGGYGGSSTSYVKGTGRRFKGEGLADADPNGRWPSNVVLVHDESCATNCTYKCPVYLIDRMTGVRRAGMNINTTKLYTNGFSKGTTEHHESYGDEGGASRFYPTFRSAAELVEWLRALVDPSLCSAQA